MFGFASIGWLSIQITPTHTFQPTHELLLKITTNVDTFSLPLRPSKPLLEAHRRGKSWLIGGRWLYRGTMECVCVCVCHRSYSLNQELTNTDIPTAIKGYLTKRQRIQNSSWRWYINATADLFIVPLSFIYNKCEYTSQSWHLALGVSVRFPF
jgi:hypothetical protein